MVYFRKNIISKVISKFKYFFATANATEPKTCDVGMESTSCSISGHVEYKHYEVSLWACFRGYKTANPICSAPAVTADTKTFE